MNTNNDQMSPSAVRIGAAELQGYAWEMLLFANVYQKSNAETIGILWDIDDEILSALDMREGFPTFYTRLIVDVVHNGEVMQAWVYTMTDENRDRLTGTTPSEHYYNSVVTGYATSGLALPN